MCLFVHLEWLMPYETPIIRYTMYSEELSTAIGQLRGGKAQGPDNTTRILASLWPKMPELAQGVLLFLPQQTSNTQDLAKGNNHCPTRTQQTNGQPKELPPNLTSLRPIQGPGATSPTLP